MMNSVFEKNSYFGLALLSLVKADDFCPLSESDIIHQMTLP